MHSVWKNVLNINLENKGTPTTSLSAANSPRKIWEISSVNQFKLVPGPSSIPGAGKGLFVVGRCIQPGECIGHFGGRLVDRQELFNNFSETVFHKKISYSWNVTRAPASQPKNFTSALITLTKQRQIILDPTDDFGNVRLDDIHCLLAFVNESCVYYDNNLICKITPGTTPCVEYFATRRIKEFEELFVYYGGGYTRKGYKVTGCENIERCSVDLVDGWIR